MSSRQPPNLGPRLHLKIHKPFHNPYHTPIPFPSSFAHLLSSVSNLLHLEDYSYSSGGGSLAARRREVRFRFEHRIRLPTSNGGGRVSSTMVELTERNFRVVREELLRMGARRRRVQGVVEVWWFVGSRWVLDRLEDEAEDEAEDAAEEAEEVAREWFGDRQGLGRQQTGGRIDWERERRWWVENQLVGLWDMMADVDDMGED
ncbi:hypothetical protein B0T20DRAFT_467425 [Sordaria brevicollis]|uniref:Uncharacterized protein n=1 Tax=Sordaria brevicollis TaxID=83679 RepID=A0AAE0UDW0_SORBR|nr:hypothetical protein B0T20DRAFT_467425 [Sordaria brevicollis]